MKIGDIVKITRCEGCPKVVGKIATIIKMDIVDEAVVKFGRGRPPLNCPNTFTLDQLELVQAAYTL